MSTPADLVASLQFGNMVAIPAPWDFPSDEKLELYVTNVNEQTGVREITVTYMGIELKKLAVKPDEGKVIWTAA